MTSISKPKLLAVLIIILIGSTSFYLGQVLGIPSARNSIVEPGSLTNKCTYDIYSDGTNINALDTTGSNKFQNPDFLTVFQNILNAINGGGGDICIEGGTYSVSGNLDAGITSAKWQNLIIEGQGYSTRLKLSPGTARPMICSPAADNTTITNLVFDGNSVNEVDSATRGSCATGGELVTFVGQGSPTVTASDRLVIQNIWCINARIGACLDVDSTNDLAILQSHFENNGIQGAAFPTDCIHIGAVGTPQTFSIGPRVWGNYINGCTDTGIALDSVHNAFVNLNFISNCQSQCIALSSANGGPAYNNTVNGNVILQTLYAAPAIFINYFGGTYPAVDTLTISGNTISTTQTTGGANNLVNVYFSKRITFTGNSLDAPQLGQFLTYWPNDQQITVSGNSFMETKATGGSHLNDFTNDTDLVFTGNLLQETNTNVNAYALYISTSTGVTITGNTFTNIASGGAGKDTYFSALTGFTINGNIFDTATYGITFQGSASTKGVISGNTFNAVTNSLLFTVGPTSLLIVNNVGYNPINKITNFVQASASTFAPWGGGSTVVASTDYVVDGGSLYFTSSVGTGVSITVKDGAGNTVYAPGATLTVPFLVPYGNKINFGAFSVAPTVTVWFI